MINIRNKLKNKIIELVPDFIIDQDIRISIELIKAYRKE